MGSQIIKSERRSQVRKGPFQAIFVENPTQGMMEGWVRVRILLIAFFFFSKSSIPALNKLTLDFSKKKDYKKDQIKQLQKGLQKEYTKTTKKKLQKRLQKTAYKRHYKRLQKRLQKGHYKR